jgi:hypothetical protein
MAHKFYLLIVFTYIDNIRNDMAFKDVVFAIFVDTEASVNMKHTVFSMA